MLFRTLQEAGKTFFDKLDRWFLSEEVALERRGWHKKPLSVVLLYVFIAILFYLNGRIAPPAPAPGVAVAVLAVAAAVMALLGEMGGREKVAWIFLLFGFLGVELYSINTERASQEEIQKEARREQLEHFREIGGGIEASIRQSDEHFKSTIGETNKVLLNITGDSSFAVVVPMNQITRNLPTGQIPLAIENHGNFSLTGITVTLYQSGVWIGMTHESVLRSVKDRVNVGTLHSGERLVLDRQIIPENLMKVDDEHGEKNFYRVFVSVSAQNFTVTEYLDFKKNNEGHWLFKYKAFHQYPLPKDLHKEHRLPDKLIEEIDWSSDSNDLVRKPHAAS